MLIRILLFKKLDLTEFGTKKSDCGFGIFRSLGGGGIFSKFDTIIIKGKFLRYQRKSRQTMVDITCSHMHQQFFYIFIWFN